MAGNAATANWWGLATVVALAVGRESAETVVFLYGLGAQYTSVWSFLQVLALGIGAAWLTFWALQQGSRFFSWRTFFRVSEILLLLLAGALLVSAIEKTIALDLLPALVDPLWDTSMLVDDSSRAGGLLAAFTGYRARPALLTLMLLAVYWVSVVVLLRRASRPIQTR
jgi:high-affinity iron transporter